MGTIYEQFVTYEWKQFVELALRKGGPAARTNVEAEAKAKTRLDR